VEIVDTLVFTEVKTRRSADHGHPAEAVTPDKQRRITRLAVTFMKRHGLLDPAYVPGGGERILAAWDRG
jgi:putative endonuclease